MLEIHSAGEISASVSDRIPPELFYDIFRLLSDDKDTLASCACVSRYWRSVSLPWLFSQVTVPEAKSFASFVDYFNTYPDLGAHIKTLRLIGDPSAPHSSTSHLNLHVFLSIISGFSALRTLHLWDINACECPCTLQLTDVDRRLKPGLRELSIRNPRGEQSWTTTLISLLSRYSADTLEIVGVRLSDQLDEDMPAFAAPSSPAAVRRLTIAGSRWLDRSSYAFFEVMLCPGALQSLSVRCPTPECATYARSLLLAVGQNVTKLSLDIAALSVHTEGEQRPHSTVRAFFLRFSHLPPPRSRLDGRRRRDRRLSTLGAPPHQSLRLQRLRLLRPPSLHRILYRPPLCLAYAAYFRRRACCRS